MTLNDLLGNDDAPWMDAPGKPCDPPINAAEFIRQHSDDWFEGRHSDEYARDLCAGCPVVADCFAYAMARPELEGIFGGTTDVARRRARKRAARRALNARKRAAA